MNHDNDKIIAQTRQTQKKTLESLARTKRQILQTDELAYKTLTQLDQQHLQFDSIIKEVDHVDTNLDKTIELQRQMSLYSCLCTCLFFSRTKSKLGALDVNNPSQRDSARHKISKAQEDRGTKEGKATSIHKPKMQDREYYQSHQDIDLATQQKLTDIAKQDKLVDEAVSDLMPMLDQLQNKAKLMTSQTKYFNEKIGVSQPKIDEVLDKTLKVVKESQNQKFHA
jgi:hypothetical protein